MRRHFDVIYVADPRLHGGVTKSIVEEIKAHSTAGYTTGLLPVFSPIPRTRPVDPPLMRLIESGLVELLPPDGRYDTGLVLARGPVMFGERQPMDFDVRADSAVLVVNAMPLDSFLPGRTPWDPIAIAQSANDMFSTEWSWWPLSDVVRRVFQEAHPEIPLADGSWTNVIDLDAWRTERGDEFSSPIVLGRHSRDNPVKWPESARVLLSAYPDDPQFDVRILGGASTPRKLLVHDRLPPNWTVFPFDGVSVGDFLASIDVFSFFHHSGWIEAFGRAPLEAIASGAVTVLPEYLSAVFGDAALYSVPEESLGLIGRIAESSKSVREQREMGWQTVYERFSYASHVRRLESFIGPPSESPRRHLSPTNQPRSKENLRPGLVLVTDPEGFAPASRLAMSLSDRFAGVLVDASDSQAIVPVSVAREVIPGPLASGLSIQEWSGLQTPRLNRRVDLDKPVLLVAVGEAAAHVLVGVKKLHDAQVWVWMVTSDPVDIDGFEDLASRFDVLVRSSWVETPSEGVSRSVGFSLSIDRLFQPSPRQTLTREAARESLGLDDSQIAVLVDPGQDSERYATWTSELAELLTGQGIATFWTPKVRGAEGDARVQVLSPPEIAILLAAFDLAIAWPSAGRVSESLRGSLPTLYIGGLSSQSRHLSSLVVGGAAARLPAVRDQRLKQTLEICLTPSWQLRTQAALSAWGSVDEHGCILATIESTAERLVTGV